MAMNRERSVLPAVAGVSIAGGFRQRHGAELSLVIGWSAFVLFEAVFGSLNMAWGMIDGLRPTRMVALVLFVATAAAYIRFSAPKYLAFKGRWFGFRRFGTTFLSTHPWPIRLGEQVRFDLLLRRHILQTADRVEARVVCTDVRHDEKDGVSTHVRRTLRLPPIELSAAAPLQRLQWTIEIPRDEAASLKLAYIAVEWRFIAIIQSDIESIPIEFPLLVLPQVAP